MPCESCNVQFTVFRRKRSCPDCKRFYCSNCLLSPPSPGRNSGALCERCSIFAKRPLQRGDLLRLKPKDLIFYLQSKHISTAGCVEKEELVLLVLNHVQQNDVNNARSCNGGQSPSNSSGRRDAESAHSFEGLKQSCQNFFSNISDNISDSFTSFESKAASKNSQNDGRRTQSASNNCATHIIDQPRVSTREIPTYASFQSGQTQSAASISVAAGVQVVEPTSGGTNIVNRPPSVSPSLPTSNEASNSQTTSPLASLSSLASHAPGNSNSQGRRTLGCPPEVSTSAYKRDSHSGDGEVHSECECSDDDEIITAFSERVASERSENLNLLGDAPRSTDHLAAAATPSTSSGAYGKQSSAHTSKGEACDGDQSSQSSFEELGAIGGISDDSKTTTDTNSSHVDQWQLLDTQRPSVPAINAHDVATGDGGNLQVALLPSHDNPEPLPPAQRNKKVMRRRSDGHLNRRRSQSDDDSPTGAPSGNLVLHEVDETDATLPAGRRQGHEPLSNCERCGKRRANIRRYIERMRRHLENAHLSEEEIKSELNAFLSFLEKRSVECSDSETAVSSVSGTNCPQATPGMPVNLQEDVLYGIDENDGIYVYGTSFMGCGGSGKISSRFINLDDYDSVDDLDSLSVKQLKEVLMLNRVDYKGCCEKQELLDRVQRLWKNLKSTPAVDKLQTDELCKICMDAPIECVILECGHMATCTNCGKVLSECPICRQYIVRVVRFFRA